ncbi:hypothetical protein MD484_g7095, partial [Candolleomyces efflorescens]
MDSFTTIKPAHIPTNSEGDRTAGSGGYCVVFAKEGPAQTGGEEFPADFEGDGTAGSGGYCTIA